MKNKIATILSIITNIILIGIICTLISKNGNIIKEKQIIKEMSESIQLTDLNNQINALNTEHTEYMNYIQTCKTKIATALTNEGVTTSNQVTLETMAGNISKVLQARTSNATATAEDITNGKTAWVDGREIIGTSRKYQRQTSNNIPEGIMEIKVMHVWYTTGNKNSLDISGEFIESVSVNRLYQDGSSGIYSIGLDEYTIETTGKKGTLSITVYGGGGTNHDYYYFYY